MHSRILVLDNAQYDCDEVFEQMSTWGNGVDYVAESESSFESDYKWCMDFMTNYGLVETDDKRGFRIANGNEIFAKMTEFVKNNLPVSALNRWKITEELTMKHSFWFWDGEELLPLPYFMEYHKEDETFKITKFLDYHF